MKTLDQQDAQVIEDVARLSKSDFVDLYVEMGYDKIVVGPAWHSLRVTPKVQAIRAKFGHIGRSGQPLSFISDIKAEAKIRMGGQRKLKAEFTVEEMAPKLSNNKESIAKMLIEESGVIKAKDLAEQGGFSIPYAYTMLKKYKSTVG